MDLTWIYSEVEKLKSHVVRQNTDSPNLAGTSLISNVDESVYNNPLYIAAASCIAENERAIFNLKELDVYITNLKVHYEKELEILQQTIDDYQHRHNSKTNNCSIRGNWCYMFGIPYFKSYRFYSSPLNRDAIEKKTKDFFSVIDLPATRLWKEADKKRLVKAIRSVEISKQTKDLKTEINEIKQKLGECTDDIQIQLYQDVLKECCEKLSLIMRKSLRNLICCSGEDYDWLKISNVDFHDTHTENECRSIWYNYLHPSINKSEWTKAENVKLCSIVAKHNFQNWDAIAAELDTNRSAYQCITHYQTRLNKTMRRSKWSVEEDNKLFDVVNSLRVGNYIPWAKVAYSMEGRTKIQVYNRWSYSLNPEIKKGRFTKEEDLLIIAGIRKYGADFSRISQLLPGRTSIQIRDRYNTVLQYQKPCGPWTKDEDNLLLELVKLHGRGNWSLISQHFYNRNRTQVRHRYTTIRNWLRKNPGKQLPIGNKRRISIDVGGPEKMWENVRKVINKERVMNDKENDTELDKISLHELKETLGLGNPIRFTLNNISQNVDSVDKEYFSFFSCGYVQRGGRKMVHYDDMKVTHLAHLMQLMLSLMSASINIPVIYSLELLTDIDEYVIELLRQNKAQNITSTVRNSEQQNMPYIMNMVQSIPKCNRSRQIQVCTFEFPSHYNTDGSFEDGGGSSGHSALIVRDYSYENGHYSELLNIRGDNRENIALPYNTSSGHLYNNQNFSSQQTYSQTLFNLSPFQSEVSPFSTSVCTPWEENSLPPFSICNEAYNSHDVENVATRLVQNQSIIDTHVENGYRYDSYDSSDLNYNLNTPLDHNKVNMYRNVGHPCVNNIMDNYTSEEQISRCSNVYDSNIPLCCPPNHTTIVGLRTIILSYQHLLNMTMKEPKQLGNDCNINLSFPEIQSNESVILKLEGQSEQAANLWKKRFFSLFWWPAILSKTLLNLIEINEYVSYINNNVSRKESSLTLSDLEITPGTNNIVSDQISLNSVDRTNLNLQNDNWIDDDNYINAENQRNESNGKNGDLYESSKYKRNKIIEGQETWRWDQDDMNQALRNNAPKPFGKNKCKMVKSIKGSNNIDCRNFRIDANRTKEYEQGNKNLKWVQDGYINDNFDSSIQSNSLNYQCKSGITLPRNYEKEIAESKFDKVAMATEVKKQKRKYTRRKDLIKTLVNADNGKLQVTNNPDDCNDHNINIIDFVEEEFLATKSFHSHNDKDIQLNSKTKLPGNYELGIGKSKFHEHVNAPEVKRQKRKYTRRKKIIPSTTSTKTSVNVDDSNLHFTNNKVACNDYINLIGHVEEEFLDTESFISPNTMDTQLNSKTKFPGNSDLEIGESKVDENVTAPEVKRQKRKYTRRKNITTSIMGTEPSVIADNSKLYVTNDEVNCKGNNINVTDLVEEEFLETKSFISPNTMDIQLNSKTKLPGNSDLKNVTAPEVKRQKRKYTRRKNITPSITGIEPSVNADNSKLYFINDGVACNGSNINVIDLVDEEYLETKSFISPNTMNIHLNSKAKLLGNSDMEISGSKVDENVVAPEVNRQKRKYTRRKNITPKTGTEPSVNADNSKLYFTNDETTCNRSSMNIIGHVGEECLEVKSFKSPNAVDIQLNSKTKLPSKYELETSENKYDDHVIAPVVKKHKRKSDRDRNKNLLMMKEVRKKSKYTRKKALNQVIFASGNERNISITKNNEIDCSITDCADTYDEKIIQKYFHNQFGSSGDALPQNIDLSHEKNVNEGKHHSENYKNIYCNNAPEIRQNIEKNNKNVHSGNQSHIIYSNNHILDETMLKNTCSVLSVEDNELDGKNMFANQSQSFVLLEKERSNFIELVDKCTSNPELISMKESTIPENTLNILDIVVNHNRPGKLSSLEGNFPTVICTEIIPPALSKINKKETNELASELPLSHENVPYASEQRNLTKYNKSNSAGKMSQDNLGLNLPFSEKYGKKDEIRDMFVGKTLLRKYSVKDEKQRINKVTKYPMRVQDCKIKNKMFMYSAQDKTVTEEEKFFQNNLKSECTVLSESSTNMLHISGKSLHSSEGMHETNKSGMISPSNDLIISNNKQNEGQNTKVTSVRADCCKILPISIHSLPVSDQGNDEGIYPSEVGSDLAFTELLENSKNIARRGKLVVKNSLQTEGCIKNFANYEENITNMTNSSNESTIPDSYQSQNVRSKTKVHQPNCGLQNKEKIISKGIASQRKYNTACSLQKKNNENVFNSHKKNLTQYTEVTRPTKSSRSKDDMIHVPSNSTICPVLSKITYVIKEKEDHLATGKLINKERNISTRNNKMEYYHTKSLVVEGNNKNVCSTYKGNSTVTKNMCSKIAEAYHVIRRRRQPIYYGQMTNFLYNKSINPTHLKRKHYSTKLNSKKNTSEENNKATLPASKNRGKTKSNQWHINNISDDSSSTCIQIRTSERIKRKSLV